MQDTRIARGRAWLLSVPTASDRVFWLALRRCWPRWKETLAIVQPETVIRWHREGFRRYWRWKSRRRAGRPSTTAEIRALVRRMAAENPTWGAPRIHGEILMLGLEVSERTVSRSMPRRPARPDARQRWRTFLANHREVIAAIDFFTVPTVTFRVLYVFFVFHHARRELLHFRVTGRPTAAWITQQLREAFPYDPAPRISSSTATPSTATRSSRRSATWASNRKQITAAVPAEWGRRTLRRTARRDLLDHVIVLNESHLQRLLAGFASYYHDDRTHLSLKKHAPAMRALETKPRSSRRTRRASSPWWAPSSLCVARGGLTLPLDQSVAAASSCSGCADAEGRPPPSLSTGGHDPRRHTQGRVRPAC